VEIKILSGRSGEAVSPTLNHVPVTAIDARIASGASFNQNLEAGDNAFVLVVEGEAKVGSQATTVAAGEIAWLSLDEKGTGSHVTILRPKVTLESFSSPGAPFASRSPSAAPS
jgi:redox-sensitive bicupin YhaK (pirin superfamily)